MKRFLLLLFLVVLAYSCKSKNVATSRKHPKTVISNTASKPTKAIDAVVKSAKKFKGTRYKYGGDDRRGMDCSGLVYTSFKQNDIELPRSTTSLKTSGNWVDLKDVSVGDLVFFATKKNSRSVNHVGIVTTARDGAVEFIHASTSKGVIISSLAERYWYFAFVQARRVL